MSGVYEECTGVLYSIGGTAQVCLLGYQYAYRFIIFIQRGLLQLARSTNGGKFQGLDVWDEQGATHAFLYMHRNLLETRIFLWVEAMHKFLFKMRKTFMYFFLCLSFPLLCYAQTDSEMKQARHKVATFLNVTDNYLSQVNISALSSIRSICVFNDSTKGSFVITSTNENMPEILGYSDNGLFDGNNIPPQLINLLEEYETISQYGILSTKVSNATSLKITQMKTASKILSTASYNQETPYNNYCPNGCYTGCTATAMSIAMRYYEWPTYGRGEHSYEWNGKTLSQNFNTNFDWSNMLTAYTKDNYNTTQGNAVAKLCHACGVSVNMNYSTTGSSGSIGAAALSFVKYFKFSPEVRLLHQKTLGYTSNEWMAMIKQEIDAGRPILYCGNNSTSTSGHAFIIQGYKDNYVNVNWGWGGHYNGYFLLSSMIPSNSSEYDYSYDHWMIVNITPDYSESEFSPLQTARVVSEQSMTSNTEVVKKNNKFIVTTGNLDNRDDKTFNGQIAIALINKERTIREIVGTKTITLDGGHYYKTLSFSCKSSINSKEGDSLALMWRYADADDWKCVPGDGVVKSVIAVNGVNETEDGIPYAMLTSVWGQQEAFSALCPNKYKPGCAAVAVGQIMNYYRTTNSGYGTNSYQYIINKTDTAEVSIDYSQHKFDWANIIDNYANNTSATAAQKKAVCDLLYTAGTALFMQYRDRSSGSAPKNESSMLWGLHHYLHFNPTSIHRYRRFYSTAEWIEMLDAQLSKHQPVFYGGSYCYFDDDALTSKRIGHYWVIDGKNDEGFYHANFGTGSSRTLKYTALDMMQQTVADNVYPGGFAIFYGHNDMMITDIVPQADATDADYALHNLILTQPIYFASEPKTITKSLGLAEAFNLEFDFSNYDRDRGTTYYKIGLYQNGQLKGFANANNTQGYHSITLGAGHYLHREKSFVLPSGLSAGTYEMHFVTQNRETGKWQQVLESVKGGMKLVCSNGKATITLPVNHTFSTGLYLKKDVSEVVDEYNDAQAKGNGKDGVSLRLSLVNSSDNNFCDTLRLEFKMATGETKILNYNASVYDNSEIEYHIFVPSQLVDLSETYTLNLYYYDSTSKAYIPLTRTSNITHVNGEVSSSSDLYVYRTNGTIVARIPRQRISRDYFTALSKLAHGVYIIKDRNETRKVIK